LILDSVTYYQVVFTLPSELSELALANRTELADLLFGSAWKSLRKTIRVQQDYDPASMMVLHTWNQQLQPHWHVHALVPGSGPSLTGNHWKEAEAPEEAANSDDHYLGDAISLRESFRKSAIAHLKRLRRGGKLKFGGKFAHLRDEQAWEAFCQELASVDWVSFIQPPPTPTCSAEQVIRYLTRYLTGGPISDHRIVSADAQEVTFMARQGERTGGDREQLPVTLSTLEFIRRWCQHIQSDQLTKTRYFGGWSGQRRTKYLQRCRELLGQTDSELAGKEPSAEGDRYSGDQSEGDDSLRCPQCDQVSLVLVSETARPSWNRVLWHLDDSCPSWYAEIGHQEHRRYLQQEYGIDYEDWYLETQVESAMKPAESSRPIQLYLPGLLPAADFLLESF
jgi:hypothetical protein